MSENKLEFLRRKNTDNTIIQSNIIPEARSSAGVHFSSVHKHLEDAPIVASEDKLFEHTRQLI